MVLEAIYHLPYRDRRKKCFGGALRFEGERKFQNPKQETGSSHFIQTSHPNTMKLMCSFLNNIPTVEIKSKSLMGNYDYVYTPYQKLVMSDFLHSTVLYCTELLFLFYSLYCILLYIYIYILKGVGQQLSTKNPTVTHKTQKQKSTSNLLSPLILLQVQEKNEDHEYF